MEPSPEITDAARRAVVSVMARHFPDLQAVYLFGSCITDHSRPDSDVDIAALLPAGQAAEMGSLLLHPCRFELEDALGREVDLLNARLVSTVFQKEIIIGERLYTDGSEAAAEFEMLALSYYQQLNQEREGILMAFRESGKAYAV